MTETIPTGLRLGEGFRYVAAAAVAAMVDLAVAWLAHACTGVPLPVAAAMGVLAGGLVAYFLLEFWAFRREASAVSLRRLAGLLSLVALTLLLRSGLVALLCDLFPAERSALPILLVAFGLTFTLNFVINRLVIFNRRTPRPSLRQSLR